jgi:hypothetical protein
VFATDDPLHILEEKLPCDERVSPFFIGEPIPEKRSAQTQPS